MDIFNIDQKQARRFAIRLGWISGAFLIVIGIVSAIEQKEGSPAQGIFVNIEPLEKDELLITEEDVLVAIDQSFGVPLKGLAIANVNVARIEKILEEEPFILDANVFIDAKNYINITVQQRQPILRIIDNNGLNYYLDENGFRMPLSRHSTARVLVATGNLPPHTPEFLKKEKDMLKNTFLFARDRILEDPFFNALVEQIYINQKKEVVMVPKMGQQKILMGRYEDIETKLNKLLIFYQEALPKEGWNKYKTINLKYKDQIVCEKR
ncbi:MAG: hypothetical protein AAFO07_03390 [Bacteroidota bacterium]